MAGLAAQGAGQKPRTLKEVLLEQLHTTHDKEDWFVPVNIAVEGLTPEQAKWTDGKGNHSVGQLANHLAFWNDRALLQFEGKKPTAFSGNNEETFNNFDASTWTATVQRLDDVMKRWEKAVSEADEAKIADSASLIAHVSAHNAYHVGQMIFVRKLQGVWDPGKGVK
jgi:uncharacterized damage-inducible protein DinB